jgi:pSer/pThr/pTyr-binding forkhead associated (FHA) protein
MGGLLLKIGKSPENDVVINNSFVSDTHLELYLDESETVFLTDLKSENGTFVNGKRLKGYIELFPKDEVFIGNGYFLNWEKILKDMQNNKKKNLDIKKKDSKKSVVKKGFLLRNLDLFIIYTLIILLVIYLYLSL